MLDNIAKQPASDQDPPHPVPLYTFKAPNGVWVPAPHFYRALRFQRHTGGFQRPIFIEHYGSSATLVDSSAPFLSSVTVPAPYWWIPAPHFYRASRFQRHTGGFQRPMFIEHCGSSATLVDSSAPFSSGIMVPAPHLWIPAPHFIEHYGSSATLVHSSAPFLSSITVPAPHWWIPALHFCRDTSERVHLCVRNAPSNYYLNR